MEVQDSKWREYTGKVPEPRPGSVRFPVCLLQRHSPLCSSRSLQCITDLHRSQSINTSRDLPDNVLTFARRHPLMAGQVHPIGLRPLMFKRSVNYVRIAVHKEPALDGNLYTVLFLGTGEFREGTLTSSSAFASNPEPSRVSPSRRRLAASGRRRPGRDAHHRGAAVVRSTPACRGLGHFLRTGRRPIGLF